MPTHTITTWGGGGEEEEEEEKEEEEEEKVEEKVEFRERGVRVTRKAHSQSTNKQ